MKQLILVLFLISSMFFGFSQTLPEKGIGDKEKSSETISFPKKKSKKNILDKAFSDKLKNKAAKIENYLIISHKNDTTYVDTTLSIKKEYKFNYLRKDEFGLMPLANMGQSYNSLTYNVKNDALLPSIGARSKHFNYMEAKDIFYYDVPTPLTELFYKTGFEQGQVLDAFFTTNTSKQFNFSIAYKGMRSQGKYQHILSSSGNLRLTTSYKSKNKRYVLNAHATLQDVLNEENGGIIDDNVPFFENGDESFRDRGVFEVNFEDAENLLKGRRFYLNHSYAFFSKQDSVSTHSLNLTHIAKFEKRFYQFAQATSNTDFFGEAFKNRDLFDKATLKESSNTLQLNYTNNILGQLKFKVAHDNYTYGYDKTVILNGERIPNRLDGDIVSIGAEYKKQIGGFYIEGAGGLNISGNLDGNYILAKAGYTVNKDLSFNALLNHSNRAPNFNTQLYQSDYLNYNWKNDFKNISIQQIGFILKSNKWINLNIDASTINNYVYFAEQSSDSLVKPFQDATTITYLRAKLNKAISYKHFTLDNTFMYQNVSSDNAVLNVPQFITRNTLYYSKQLFKGALFLQTGVTFNYFTAFSLNAYDPLLGEFYVQNQKEFGGFPRFDFFINAKVRQTRIFLKAEHFNSSFTGFDYYSAPNHPYRDFTVRFGIVWNFFL